MFESSIQSRKSPATCVEWVSMQRRETGDKHMLQNKPMKYLIAK